jgi:site-specific DNA-methyltransferase (adenine-specific)
LGSFSTAKVAIGLNRRATGFEKSEIAFKYQNPLMPNIEVGNLLKNLRQPPENALFNQGKKLEAAEINEILALYKTYKNEGKTKKDSITLLTAKMGRGYWSLLKIIDKFYVTSDDVLPQLFE